MYPGSRGFCCRQNRDRQRKLDGFEKRHFRLTVKSLPVVLQLTLLLLWLALSLCLWSISLPITWVIGAFTLSKSPRTPSHSLQPPTTTATIMHLTQRLHLIHDRPFSINFLVENAFGVPSKVKVFIITLPPCLPLSIPNVMNDYSPVEGLSLAREHRRVAVKAARDWSSPRFGRLGAGNLAGIFDATRCVRSVVLYRREL